MIKSKKALGGFNADLQVVQNIQKNPNRFNRRTRETNFNSCFELHPVRDR
jgi:hypothetical protein